MTDPGPDGAPPQPSEEVHLPEPSYLPVLVAFGVTHTLVGLVLSYVISGIGLVIAAAAAIRWIRLTREEISQLPLEH